MPIYEFECGGCGKVGEKIVVMGTTEIVCENCKNKMVKIPSLVSFRIEGYSEANGYSDGGKKK